MSTNEKIIPLRRAQTADTRARRHVPLHVPGPTGLLGEASKERCEDPTEKRSSLSHPSRSRIPVFTSVTLWASLSCARTPSLVCVCALAPVRVHRKRASIDGRARGCKKSCSRMQKVVLKDAKVVLEGAKSRARGCKKSCSRVQKSCSGLATERFQLRSRSRKQVSGQAGA
eukprot:4391662-Pleurochrysis_carterae.AAC.2